MVCVADPLWPASVTVALICCRPVALLVSVLEAAPARLVGAAGVNTPEGTEKRTTVPSATAVPLTVALARTAIGVPTVNTLSVVLGVVICTAMTEGGASPESPPPQEARSAVKGRAHRRKRVWAWCMVCDGGGVFGGIVPGFIASAVWCSGFTAA